MKAILTVGVSASGKSTWAEQFIASQENPGQWYNSNRDDIRWKLLGVKDWSKWNWKREKEVTSIHRASMAKAACEGKIVLKQQCTKEEEQQGLLIPVFRDGDVLIDDDFVTVRSRAGYIQY